MSNITAGMVAELRAKTDAPMMECKKALVESGGDIERARDILRAKGQAGALQILGIGGAVQRYAPAIFGKFNGDCAANTARRTGDENPLLTHGLDSTQGQHPPPQQPCGEGR